MMSTLDWINVLSWIFCGFSSLKQKSTGKHVTSLKHVTLIQGQPDFVLNVVCLAEKQQILMF